MMVFDKDILSSILAKDSAEVRGEELEMVGRFEENEVSEIWENLNGKWDGTSGAVVWDSISSCDAGIFLVSGTGH